MQSRHEPHAAPHRLAALGSLLWFTPMLALAQSSPFMTGATALQTNILILRCSGSEHGGTSQFASRLIGEREVLRRQTARARDRAHGFAARGARRSTSVSEQHVTEAAVLPAELEQLPDLTGYLKTACSPAWLRVSLHRGA
jgi:Type IV secretion-system coupling protein DNA-binding domain